MPTGVLHPMTKTNFVSSIKYTLLCYCHTNIPLLSRSHVLQLVCEMLHIVWEGSTTVWCWRQSCLHHDWHWAVIFWLVQMQVVCHYFFDSLQKPSFSFFSDVGRAYLTMQAPTPPATLLNTRGFAAQEKMSNCSKTWWILLLLARLIDMKNCELSLFTGSWAVAGQCQCWGLWFLWAYQNAESTSHSPVMEHCHLGHQDDVLTDQG